MRDDKFNVSYISTTMKMRDEKVHQIINLKKQKDFVHQKKTETNDFNCGFPLIVLIRDSFVLSANTKIIIEDFKNLEDLFDFSNLDEINEIFSNRNKKLIGKFKIETPKNAWIDEFVCRRKKIYALKCGVDSKKKSKGVSKSYSKDIKIDEKKCLDGGKYQEECNKHNILSLNHEMHL